MRTSRSLGGLALALILVTTLGSAELAAGQPGSGSRTSDAAPGESRCHPSWKLVGTPADVNPLDPVDHMPQGVSAISPGRTWIPGETYSMGDTRSWNMRRSGGALASAPAIPTAPYVQTTYSGHRSAFDSPQHGWVLGSQFIGRNFVDSVARWYDGRWTLTPTALSPDATTLRPALVDVVSFSPTDSWAVGGLFDVTYGLVDRPSGALIEHWNGTRWTSVPNPAARRLDAQLRGVSATSPHDIWVVGAQADADGGSVPLALHYNGRRWREVPTPPGASPSGLRDVSATAGNDVWAVGGQLQPGTVDQATPMVQQWNGRRWRLVDLPKLENARLNHVYAAGPARVWAILERPEGADVLLQRRGTRWSTRPVPGDWGVGNRVFYDGIDGTGADDVWATGLVVDEQPSLTTIRAQVAHLSCGRS